MRPMGALLYFGLKFVAYSGWCYLGLFKFRRQQKPVLLRALAYGFLRLLLGFFFGVLIWLLSSSLMSALGYGLSQNILTYLFVYVPVRWIEWTIMAMIIVPGSFSLSRWGVGIGVNDRLWRLGGIAISCLADIPLIASLGGVVPVGRFLC
jgi:hypothetical protein